MPSFVLIHLSMPYFKRISTNKLPDQLASFWEGGWFVASSMLRARPNKKINFLG